MIHPQTGFFYKDVIQYVVWLFLLLVLVTLIVATVANHSLSLGEKDRAIVLYWAIWVISLAVLIATYLALWLQYTPASVQGVLGLQFRYANPLIIPLVLCMAGSLDIIKLRKMHPVLETHSVSHV